GPDSDRSGVGYIGIQVARVGFIRIVNRQFEARVTVATQPLHVAAPIQHVSRSNREESVASAIGSIQVRYTARAAGRGQLRVPGSAPRIGGIIGDGGRARSVRDPVNISGFKTRIKQQLLRLNVAGRSKKGQQHKNVSHGGRLLFFAGSSRTLLARTIFSLVKIFQHCFLYIQIPKKTLCSSLLFFNFALVRAGYIFDRSTKVLISTRKAAALLVQNAVGSNGDGALCYCIVPVKLMSASIPSIDRLKEQMK